MPGGRGGRRKGTPGKSYGNRTDLNQPMMAAKGQAYGAAKAQMDAQRAQPLPNQQMPGGLPQLPPDVPQPGSMGDLFADSGNPDEDVMSGASMGPGLGPQAFGFDDASMGNRDLQWAQRYLPALEEAANRSGGDPARQVVRLLKSRMPLPGGRS